MGKAGADPRGIVELSSPQIQVELL